MEWSGVKGREVKLRLKSDNECMINRLSCARILKPINRFFFWGRGGARCERDREREREREKTRDRVEISSGERLEEQ